MAKATVPRYIRPGSLRQERLVNLPRKLLKKQPAGDQSPNTILAESGYQLQAENGQFLRTES